MNAFKNCISVRIELIHFNWIYIENVESGARYPDIRKSAINQINILGFTTVSRSNNFNFELS